MEAVDERDVRDLESQHQLKQYKDRIERLKKSMSSIKPSGLVIERHAVDSLTQEKVKKPKLKTTSTQTASSGVIASEQPQFGTARPSLQPDNDLSQLILVLLRTHFMVTQANPDESANGTMNMQSIVQNVFQHNALEIFKPLAQSIQKLSGQSRDSEHGSNMYSLFLTFVLEFVRSLPTDCHERAELAKSATQVLLNSSKPNIHLSLHAKLSLQLIILSDYSTATLPRCELVLSDLMNTMTTGDEAKQLFLGLYGLDLLHPIMAAAEMSPTVKLLASSVILTMCEDGDWNEDFLDQCMDNESLIDSIAACALTPVPHEYVGLYENILVLLQKVSRIPKTQAFIRNNTALMEWVQSVCDSEENLSEFMKLNAVSIWQNLME
ncbi:hypothetical protein HDU99_000249 [Rhizoclosmatium hyalinum]|nr:hypothetical protein HDU99_000249 [Rhizoclosmatium hyalinum]